LADFPSRKGRHLLRFSQSCALFRLCKAVRPLEFFDFVVLENKKEKMSSGKTPKKRKRNDYPQEEERN
jgi:hypothetical protein